MVACRTSPRFNTFVVWDFTSGDNLHVMLELLGRDSAIQVPGKQPASGGILRDVVLPGIVGAERVLVWVDKPNANVGFELGLALGFGKEVALAYESAKRPAWIDQPPLKGELVQSAGSQAALDALLGQASWYRLPLATQVRLGDKALCLRAPVVAYNKIREDCRADLESVPEAYTLPELPSQFSNVGRLVWTVTEYQTDSDQRDGKVNAANAVAAGWFAAQCLRAQGWTLACGQEPIPLLRDRLIVLRSARPGVRTVVDVSVLESPFEGLDGYETVLRGMGPLRGATGACAGGTQQRRTTADWSDACACLDEMLALAPKVAAQVQGQLEHVFAVDELDLPARETPGAQLFAAVAAQPYQVVLALYYALDELSAEDVRSRPIQRMLGLLLPACTAIAERVERGKAFDHATVAATLLRVESEVARLTQRRAYPLAIGEKVVPAHAIELDGVEGGIGDEDQLVTDVRALLADQLLGKQAFAAGEIKQIDRDLRRMMRKHAENVRYQPQTYEQAQHNRYVVLQANGGQGGPSFDVLRAAFPHLGVVLRAMDDGDCDAQEDLADRVYEVLDKEARLSDRNP